MKKTLSLILAALMLSACVSCSESPAAQEENAPAAETAAEPGADAEIVPEEPEGNGRSNIVDTLPGDLDFGGKTLNILSRGGDLDTTTEFHAEEMTGDVVNDAVFQRNTSVDERLNGVMNVILDTTASRHNGIGDKVRSAVAAGTGDYDFVANAMYNTMPLTMDNILLPVNDLPYLDFAQPWYNKAFLENTNFNGKNYCVMGELSQTMISGAFSMFFNKNLLYEFYQDTVNLYAIVNEGTWTIDKMTSLCEPVYSDTNGNGVADEGDTFGHYFTDTKTLGADSFFGASHVDYLVRSEDGSFVFNGKGERMNAFLEKMHRLLFENNNTLRLPYNNEQIMDTMIAHQTIFTTWMLTGVNFLRDMEDDFGIIPMPKLDEAQENYNAYTHDGSSAFSIPSTEADPAFVAAYLEALSAETYRVVTPAYFETALKSKYSRDSETSQMLDIIVGGIYQDLTYIYGQNLGTPIDTIRGFLGDASSCESASSKLASLEKVTIKMAETLATKYDKIK